MMNILHIKIAAMILFSLLFIFIVPYGAEVYDSDDDILAISVIAPPETEPSGTTSSDVSEPWNTTNPSDAELYETVNTDTTEPSSETST